MRSHRSTRLQPVQQLANLREENAMRELAASQKQVADQQIRLEELQRYINDYANVVPQAATPALMVNRHAFLARLQEAERYQRKLVEQSALRCEAERARWLLKRRDVGTLDQLAASYRAQERVQAERLSQKELDELASRRLLGRHHETAF